MKFFDDFLSQMNKKGHSVCGDYCLCERTEAGTLYIVCDGIGSGIYANISAITCASRIMELFRGGMSVRATAETVAASMHRARKEDIPFTAFSVALIFPDGKFTAYAYEAPNPILLQNNHATALAPRFYTAGFEVVGEFLGTLHTGDALLMFSDGVSQAGLGHGYGMGIGTDGVCDFINRVHKPTDGITGLSERVLEMCKTVSAGNFEDDTTLASLFCREAKELTLLTGPPSKQTLDKVYASDFVTMPGQKVICGSTTADIIARELGLTATTVSVGNSFEPPEYKLEGVDLVAEGAITLNQAYNILDEPTELLCEDSVAERLCLMLHNADVLRLMIGGASNIAHNDLVFKQTGVRVRNTVIRQITEKMKSKGKLVVSRYY